MNPEGILFDFGGTLASGDLDKEEFGSNLFDYIRGLGYRGSESRFTKAGENMFERLMKLRNQNREMRLEDFYQGMFFELGLYPERATLEYIHDLYIRSFNIVLITGVKEVLEYLDKRYYLAIVSNAMSNVARHALRRFCIEQHFETVIISRDLGIRKPDPEIFRYALSNLGLETSQVVHIGDSLKDDVQGAKKAGIKTIWIKLDKGNDEIQPDYTINSIKELTFLL
jgi:putative hydrolase of the HAD superfamily